MRRPVGSKQFSVDSRQRVGSKRLSSKHCQPSTIYRLLFPLIAHCSVLIALTACSYAQIKTQPSVDVFPVETAHEDGDWTLLYRDVPLEISEDGFVIFMLPRDWMPLGLSDYDHLRFSSVISEDKAVLTFERFRP